MADESYAHIMQKVDSAYAYLKQAETLDADDVPGLSNLSSSAQSLYTQAKTDVQILLTAGVNVQEQQNLEMLVHRSNVGMVYCLDVEVGAYYSAGFANYDHETAILNNDARMSLEVAVERLRQTSEAYVKFENSFVMLNATERRNKRMKILSSSLCDVYRALGNNAQKQAQLLIMPLVNEGVNISDEQFTNALRYLDESFDWYESVLEVYDETAEVGAAPVPEFRAHAIVGLFSIVLNVMRFTPPEKAHLTKPHLDLYAAYFEHQGLSKTFVLYLKAIQSKN